MNEKEVKALEVLRKVEKEKGLETISNDTGLSKELLFQCLQRGNKEGNAGIFPSMRVAKTILNKYK